MGHPGGGEGDRLLRATDLAPWWVPPIEVVDGTLRWTEVPTTEKSNARKRLLEDGPKAPVDDDEEPLLEAFAKLGDVAGPTSSTSAIEDFARIWGPLRLCREHRLPITHRLDEWRGPHDLKAATVRGRVSRPAGTIQVTDANLSVQPDEDPVAGPHVTIDADGHGLIEFDDDSPWPCEPRRQPARHSDFVEFRGTRGTGRFEESLTDWLVYAKAARSILDLAKDLARKPFEPVSTRDPRWSHLSPFLPPDVLALIGRPRLPSSSVYDTSGDVLRPMTMEERGERDRAERAQRAQHQKEVGELQREAVAQAADRWLRIGNVTATMSWWEKRPLLTFGQPYLFSALAYELALNLGWHKPQARCPFCGQYFESDRNDRWYCRQASCVTAANTYRQQESRSRRKADDAGTHEPGENPT